MKHILLRHTKPMLLAALLAGAHMLSATTLVVGSCKGSGGYSTIQAAVNAAPAGAAVQVCPGYYYEQVTITQAVTLEGITVAGADIAYIDVLSGGLIINTHDIDGRQVAAQVLVKNSSGPVNISNLTINGTGNGVSGCPPLIAGIFYQNSSGTIKEVTAANQEGNGCGNGIWIEGGSSSPVVTVENSVVTGSDLYGINTETYQQAPTALTVKITSNAVVENSQPHSAGIYVDQGSTATVSGNQVVGGGGTTDYGILIWYNSLGSVSANAVQGAYYGIGTHSDGVSVTSNKLVNNQSGVDLNTAVATIKGNSIAWTPFYGILFHCNANPNVLSNTINFAAIGLEGVPSGVSTGTNKVFNAGAIREGGC